MLLPMSAPTIRWGFIATGWISGDAAADLGHAPGAVRHAVASRRLEKARQFAAEHGFARAYGSYAELLADPDVDAVYVATPHAQHWTVVNDAIAAGKPVLVEKAFTCTHAAAADLVERARAAGVFVMEAMWNRFQPGMRELRRRVADGHLGDVRAVHADLGFVNEYHHLARLVDPANGGGALLDTCVYPAAFAQWFLGTPDVVRAVGTLGPTGVDVEAGVLLGYPSGAHAVLSCGFTADWPGGATVVGTEGHAVVEPRMNHPPRILVHRRGRDVEVIDNPLGGQGLWHEFAHVGECLAAGLTESPVMPLDDTLGVMATLDQACDQVGTPHVDEGFPAA